MRKEIIGNATLYLADCRDVLDEYHDMANAVITDPPYGINYKSGYRKISFDVLENDNIVPLWSVKLFYDVLKQNSVLYCCSSFTTYADWYREIENVGFKMQVPIVWDKGNTSLGNLHQYSSCCEMILYANKGNRELNPGTKLANLWNIPRVTGKVADQHPTEKPVRLAERCIINSCNTDDLIIDPFMGIGTTGVACANLNCRFVGVEINEKYFDNACKRIDLVNRQIRMI